VAVVRLLVHKAGARLEDKDYEGMTALHFAYFCGQLDAAAALIATGADLCPVSYSSTGATCERTMSAMRSVGMRTFVR
jgi:ankyrin repeat protein